MGARLGRRGGGGDLASVPSGLDGVLPDLHHTDKLREPGSSSLDADERTEIARLLQDARAAFADRRLLRPGALTASEFAPVRCACGLPHPTST